MKRFRDGRIGDPALADIHPHDPLANLFSQLHSPFRYNATGRLGVRMSTSPLELRDEGGPAVLIVDVPDGIMALAVDAWFPLTQGFVQFDRGPSLEALLAAWPRLEMRIMPFTDPS
jgi:hypothetical protein